MSHLKAVVEVLVITLEEVITEIDPDRDHGTVLFTEAVVVVAWVVVLQVQWVVVAMDLLGQEGDMIVEWRVLQLDREEDTTEE